MFAKIRDTEIFFDIEGSGLIVEGSTVLEKPAAFIIHGGPGADHTSQRQIFANLADRLQLVYFDHRGQGRSARGAKETYTLENNVEDMEALRQYLGLQQIVVIGTSYGGMVALSYAVRYPQFVSRLVVIASAPSYHFLERAKEILALQGTPEQKAIAQHLWDGTFADEEHLQQYFQIMAPLYSLCYNPQQTQESWKRTILSVDAINVAFSSFLRSYDLSHQLHQITSPTLVIGAEFDWICPPEFSAEIAQGISQAKLIIIPNSGHLIRADAPQALLGAISNFLFPES